jgi:hypothetical protein
MISYKNKTIFISIASYRDLYCSRTLESIYENAKYPNNIFVGLCIQNNDEDEDCLIKNKNFKKYMKNVNIIRLKAYEAKGPTWARYLCTTLFNNQDYFFQIDSHTLFDKDWDYKLMKMTDEIKTNTGSKDIVISHYPPSYEDYNNKNIDKKMVTSICKGFFNDRNMISFLGAENVNMNNHYVKTPYIAAGMFFCEGKCLKDVPYDPNLPNLFVGEEILHSARIWTSGYDIYSPTEVVIYHLYTRSDQPHIWDDKKNYNDEDAHNKVKMLLTLEEDVNKKVPEYVKENIDKYRLGNKRTLDDYYNFAGIDLKEKKVNKNFCSPEELITKVDKIDKKIVSDISYNDLLNKLYIIILWILLLIFILIFSI